MTRKTRLTYRTSLEGDISIRPAGDDAASFTVKADRWQFEIVFDGDNVDVRHNRQQLTTQVPPDEVARWRDLLERGDHTEILKAILLELDPSADIDAIVGGHTGR